MALQGNSGSKWATCASNASTLLTLSFKEYVDPRTTYQDVAATLQTYPTLKPRTRVFTNELGESNLLLNLYGSLPCQISGKFYKIPIELWIPHEYPLSSPTTYVVPTENMLLQPGNYVDNAGKCYHPYLANWKQQPNDVYNIIKLCRELSKVFGLEPPVYSKSAGTQNRKLSNGPTTPTSIHSENQIQHVKSPLNPPPSQPVPQDFNRYIVVSPVEQNNVIDQNILEQPNIMDHELQKGNNDDQRIQTLRDVNKLLHKLYDEEITRDLTKFKLNIEQIKHSIGKFDSIFEYEHQNLKNINNHLQDNSTILTNSIAQAEKTIQEANSLNDPNIDEIICAENIVHSQLYNLVAEDQAIADTIYALTKAFDNGKVPLNSFIRHVRNLSREQFMKKALIDKISEILRLYSTK